jgi:hypothetical protein
MIEPNVFLWGMLIALPVGLAAFIMSDVSNSRRIEEKQKKNSYRKRS